MKSPSKAKGVPVEEIETESQPSQNTVEFNKKLESAFDVIAQLKKQLQDMQTERQRERESWRRDRKAWELERQQFFRASTSSSKPVEHDEHVSKNSETKKSCTPKMFPSPKFDWLRTEQTPERETVSTLDKSPSLLLSSDENGCTTEEVKENIEINEETIGTKETKVNSGTPGKQSSMNDDKCEPLFKDKDKTSVSPDLIHDNPVSDPGIISPKMDGHQSTDPIHDNQVSDSGITSPKMDGHQSFHSPSKLGNPSKKHAKALKGFLLYFAENFQHVALKEGLVEESEIKSRCLDLWRTLENKSIYSKMRIPRPRVVHHPILTPKESEACDKDAYGFNIFPPKTLSEIRYICSNEDLYLEKSDRCALLQGMLNDIRKLIEDNKICVSDSSEEIELDNDTIRLLELKTLDLSNYMIDADLLHEYKRAYEHTFRPNGEDKRSSAMYEQFDYDHSFEVYPSAPDGSCFWNS